MRKINSQGTLNAYVINGHEIDVRDQFGYKIIAVIYSKSFWAAYRGLTDWDDKQVADEGDKISYEIAKQLFTTIDATIPNYNH